MIYSVAMSGETGAEASHHLLQSAHDEDLCFALWYPSHGQSRYTALVAELVLPKDGTTERRVHGNAEFLPPYFERALSLAIEREAGLAFMHSHLGPGWQDMSGPDVRAERGIAAGVLAATGFPLVGLTIASDQAWSARFWERSAPRSYERRWCENVRVIGDALRITFADLLRPSPRPQPSQVRTVSAWGERVQADLARIRTGVVGLGSVGSVVAEELARIGIEQLTVIDFDFVEDVNLDRTLHAKRIDALLGRSKVAVSGEALRNSATAHDFRVREVDASVCEEQGYRTALDCDLLFSCVDRPWARNVLDFIAYAHLIPVVDIGLLVTLTGSGRLRGADWKAQIAGPGRKCLECSGQYAPGLVAAEQKGQLDDPEYIQGLPHDHPARRNENVFAFSVNAASLGVLQMLSMVVAPADYPDPGTVTYHFVSGTADRDHTSCKPTCFTPRFLARGDSSPFVVIGNHRAADRARQRRRLSRVARIPRILRAYLQRLNVPVFNKP